MIFQPRAEDDDNKSDDGMVKEEEVRCYFTGITKEGAGHDRCQGKRNNFEIFHQKDKRR